MGIKFSLDERIVSMKPWITLLAVLGVLGVCSAASAQWTYVAPVAVPAPAVYPYWPAAAVAPAYVYRPAAVTVYRPAVTVYRPAVTVYRPAVTVYRPAVIPVPAVPVAPGPMVAEGVAPPVVYPGPIAYPACIPRRSSSAPRSTIPASPCATRSAPCCRSDRSDDRTTSSSYATEAHGLQPVGFVRSCGVAPGHLQSGAVCHSVGRLPLSRSEGAR